MLFIGSIIILFSGLIDFLHMAAGMVSALLMTLLIVVGRMPRR